MWAFFTGTPIIRAANFFSSSAVVYALLKSRKAFVFGAPITKLNDLSIVGAIYYS